MRTKGFLKFRGNKSKGVMHFINYQGNRVSLTRRNSRKVTHINQFGVIGIAPSVLSRNFEDTKVHIIEDSTFVKDVFDYMNKSKHSRYKDSYEELVVLKYDKWIKNDKEVSQWWFTFFVWLLKDYFEVFTIVMH